MRKALRALVAAAGLYVCKRRFNLLFIVRGAGAAAREGGAPGEARVFAQFAKKIKVRPPPTPLPPGAFMAFCICSHSG